MARRYTLKGAVGLGAGLWIPDMSFVEFDYTDIPYYLNTSPPYCSFFRYMGEVGGSGWRECFLPDPTDENYYGLMIQVRYSGILSTGVSLKFRCMNEENPRMYVGGTLGIIYTIALKSGGRIDFINKELEGERYWEVWNWYQPLCT